MEDEERSVPRVGAESALTLGSQSDLVREDVKRRKLSGAVPWGCCETTDHVA
jgi:hypothetical protein